MFGRRRKQHWTNQDQNREWIGVLARYNSEVGHGIVHTDDWKKYMTALQERFDKLSAEDPPW